MTLLDGIAIWGGLTGSISLLVTILAYYRDRAAIKITIAKDQRIIHGELMGYEPNKIYMIMTVSNYGRRPVTINKAGCIYLKHIGGFIFSDSMRGSKELKEGRSVDYAAEQDSIDFSDIAFFTAYDAIGNVYKLAYSSWLIRFWYWLLNITNIKTKVSAFNK